ncbi:MAG: co-chaperone GroES [Planctomycetota bacterium]|nr:co-chaperone GroES [Planctomycetota bacterium]
MGKTVITPLGDKILVKRLEAEEKTKGGIVLPDTAKEKPKEGKVIAVGSGRLLDNGKRAEFQVKKGDRILFSSYAGTEIKIEGEEYLLMPEEDVLAIVKES